MSIPSLCLSPLFIHSPNVVILFSIFIYVAASGLSCGMRDLYLWHANSQLRMWDLVPQAGIEPGPPAFGAQSPSHWTTRKVPIPQILEYLL